MFGGCFVYVDGFKLKTVIESSFWVNCMMCVFWRLMSIDCIDGLNVILSTLRKR